MIIFKKYGHYGKICYNIMCCILCKYRYWGDCLKIYIDADGCPVVNLTINIAAEFNIETVIVADTSHFFDIENPLVTTHTVSKGSDSSDFAIISRCGKGDIVITQDYALGAMCLSKGAYPINQNGRLYTDENIDMLLMQRHISKKIRNVGGKSHHIPKRTKAQDEAFKSALMALLDKLLLTKE